MPHSPFKLCLMQSVILAILAPICVLAGLLSYHLLYHNAYSAALGWLLYFLPFNFLGGFVIGLIQGLLFVLGYRSNKRKATWIIFVISAILASALNAFLQVWTIGVFSLVANLLTGLLVKRLFLDSQAKAH